MTAAWYLAAAATAAAVAAAAADSRDDLRTGVWILELYVCMNM